MRDNKQKHSETLIDQLKIFLTENKLELPLVNNLYVLQGPGSFTGVRLNLMLAKMIKMANPQVSIFATSSLKFFASKAAKQNISFKVSEKQIYTLLIDQTKNTQNYFLHDVVSFTKTTNDNKNFELISAYQSSNQVQKALLSNMDNFNLFTKMEDLNPIYCKNI